MTGSDEARVLEGSLADLRYECTTRSLSLVDAVFNRYHRQDVIDRWCEGLAAGPGSVYW